MGTPQSDHRLLCDSSMNVRQIMSAPGGREGPSKPLGVRPVCLLTESRWFLRLPPPLCGADSSNS